MRAYLQRLISTANGAESSVQPLVRSVFSPSATVSQEQLAPSLLSDDLGLAYDSKSATATDYDSRSEDPTVGDPLDDAVHEVSSRKRLTGVSNFEPLLSTQIVKPARVEESATLHSRLSNPHTPHGRPEEAGERGRTSNPKISDYVPLVDVGRTAPQHEPAASAMQGRKQTRLVSQEPARGRAGEAAPDEIQIHIGRIEIAAVPPSVRPTPPKPANNGPSLQEYLKRRDTRLQ